MNFVQMLTFWILAVTAQLAVVAIAVLLLQYPGSQGGQQQTSNQTGVSGLHYVDSGQRGKGFEWDKFSGSCGLQTPEELKEV